MKKLLTYIFAVLSTFTAFAAVDSVPADSVKAYFRIGHRQFDPALGNNRAVMAAFVDRVREAVAVDDVDHIVVRAYASPDGTNAANERLARNRCDYIVKYLVDHAGINPDLIQSIPDGIAWDELRRMVAGNPDVPAREQVLDILDNTPVWIFNAKGRIIDGRKKQLMDLRGGRPYNWMYANIFPELRNSVAVVLYTKSAAEEPAAPSEPEDVPALSESSDSSAISEPDNSYDSYNSYETIETPETAEIQRFALKTNLLYDAALMPNLELEWLINDNWSVSLEGNVAWWKFDYNKIYRLALVSPEVRYHINPRARWRGMYVGAFASGGLYQLEYRHNGYRGEGAMAGLSFGYMWPITKNLSFDAEIGAGYMYTRYKEYESVHGHKVYQLTKSLNYFGPLKLKFSIAWRFDQTVKLSKVNSAL